MDRATFGVKDASFKKTKALPNGAATVYSDGMDLGVALTGRGARAEECELLIEGPILTTAELPDTKTMKYDVQTDDNSGFTSAKNIAKEVLVQTGAGGAGAAAASARFRLPTDCERYVRVAATNDGAGDASGKSLTASLLF